MRMFDVYQKGDEGKWAFRVVDKAGAEIGHSLHDYDTRDEAQAAASAPKADLRTDFRSREEDGKFGWHAFDADGTKVAENTVWFEHMPDALANANQNGFIITVGTDTPNPVDNTPIAPVEGNVEQ